MNKHTRAVAGAIILAFAGYLIFRPDSETPAFGRITDSEAVQAPLAVPAAQPSAPPTSQRGQVAPYIPPPDPGRKGRASVSGVDSNTNGVRDDVERWIVQHVRDSPRKREALFQYARTFTSALQMKEKSEVPEASRQSFAALGCIDYAFGNDAAEFEKKQEAKKAIGSMHMNTPDRLTAMQKVQDLYAGYVDTVPDYSNEMGCSFDLDKYPR